MTLHDSDNEPDSGIVRGYLNYLTMILTCGAHRPPPSSDPQLSHSAAWTLRRRVSPSAKTLPSKQSTHFGVRKYFWLCWGYQYLRLFLVTVVRVVKVAISDGSSLRWGRRGLEEGCGGWHCVVQCSWSSVLLLLFCHLISCWTMCWLTPGWRILNVSHDSWYNSMFADCLVVSRHNMLPDNQNL